MQTGEWADGGRWLCQLQGPGPEEARHSREFSPGREHEVVR